MSNQPLPENLITGYLDNQLSPEERAELEQLLRDNPDSQQWLEQLQADKELVGKLPRFSLGEDFADRVMSDDRVEQVFGDRAVPQVAVADSDESRKATAVRSAGRSSRLKLVVAAVGSLAALVLIALGIPLLQQPFAQLETSVKEKATKSEERKDNDFAKGVPPEKGLGISNSVVADEEFLPGLAVVEGLGLGDSNEKDLMEPGGKPESKVQPGILMEIESDDEAMVADELGMSEQMEIANEPMSKMEAARERAATPSDAGSKLDRPSRLFGQENSKQLADADSKLELREESRQTLKRPKAVNDVLEIEYQAGSEMLQRFRQVLQKNAIRFAATDDHDESNELEETIDVPLRGKNNSAALVMFELTATPSQMAGLIADVQPDAVVSQYRLDVSESGMFESRVGVRKKLAELVDAKKADTLGSGVNNLDSLSASSAGQDFGFEGKVIPSQPAPDFDLELQLGSDAESSSGPDGLKKIQRSGDLSGSASEENLERKNETRERGGERRSTNLFYQTDDGKDQARKYLVLLRVAKEKGTIGEPGVPDRPVPNAPGDEK